MKIAPLHRLAPLVSCLLLGCSASAAPAPGYFAQVVNPQLEGGLTLPGGAALVWGSDGAILRSADGAHWEHARTPTSADLARVATNADGGVLVAVGARGTLLRSVDGGRAWSPVRGDAAECDLRAVVNDAKRGAWLAAGTQGCILRSVDDAKTWKRIATQATLEFHALFADPDSGNLLIGGSDGAVGFSPDGGATWHLTMIAMPEPLTPVTGFFRYGKLLLATSALGRFLTSADDAHSWDLLKSSSESFFTDSAFDPEHGAIVMTGHNGDVLRSTDGGRTWEGVPVELDGRKNYLAAVRWFAPDKSLVAVGQGGTVTRSVDGGANWTRASHDLPWELRGLIAQGNRLVAFGPGGALASSEERGTRWTTLRQPLDFPLRDVASVPGGKALIATSQLGELIRSTDGGTRWDIIDVAYPDEHTPPDLRGLVPAPAGDSMVAAGPPGAILRANADASRWDVRHWTSIDAERAFTWLLADPRRNLLVTVEARGQFQVSRDDGVTWSAVEAPAVDQPFPYWHGAIHARSGVILVGGKAGTAARSTDAARSFVPIAAGTDEDLYGSYADEREDLLFLMGADGTLLRSTDLGATWAAVPSGTTRELRRMFREPRDGALLCYGAHGAIIRSTDAGRTWRAVEQRTDGVLRKALLEPKTGNLLMVGGQGALLRSRDGGRSFEALDSHTTRHFLGAYADPVTGDLVLVGERIVRLVREDVRQSGRK